MTWSNVIRGVATGDAWGDPNEFKKIDMLVRNNPKGPDMPGDLRITDDTQMSLYLAKALNDTLATGDQEAIKEAILTEFKTYYLDPENYRAPGNTVMGSLGALQRGRPWQQATNPGSDGSGTVMRTSPTAFLPAELWVGVTAFAAAVTHGHPNAIAAAIINAAILRELEAGTVVPGDLTARALELADVPFISGLLDVGTWLDGFDCDLGKGFAFQGGVLADALSDLPRLADDPWGLKSDPSLSVANGGWRAPFTLPIALLAVDMFPGQPWEALRRAVTTDGDSDTIGAVAGGLLGAAYPGVFLDNWTDGVNLRDRLEPIYVKWIEEADAYPLTLPGPKRGLMRRLLRR